jgi:hypothetical protein
MIQRRFESDLERLAVAELRETFGVLLDALNDDQLAGYVQEIKSLGEDWGLETDVQIRRLAVFLYGAQIFLGDVPPWVSTIMADPQRTPQERILLLTKRLRAAMMQRDGAPVSD